MKPRYQLRERADGDGYTLLKDGIAIAGGSFQNCINTLSNEPPVSPDITVTTAGLGATPETKGESETLDKSAEFLSFIDFLHGCGWIGRNDAQHTRIKSLWISLETERNELRKRVEELQESDRLLMLELFERSTQRNDAIAARDRAEAELKVAREALSTARDWIVANTTTPVHDLLTYLDTARKEAR